MLLVMAVVFFGACVRMFIGREGILNITDLDMLPLYLHTLETTNQK